RPCSAMKSSRSASFISAISDSTAFQNATTTEPLSLEESAEKVTHNRLTQLNGIRWRYDIHGRTVEKDNGQTRWHYRYDGEHRLTEVISQPRDRNRPQTQVSFRYDPLGRRISKTRRQMLGGQPTGKPVTTRFVWEGFRLLQEVHWDVPLTYVYSDQDSYDSLARIDGVDAPEIFWFHCQPNGTPERMTDIEGQVRWEGVNSAWGKLLRESETQVSGYSQNLRMQGQYLDRETGLHYNLFRYYDPDCGRFTQQDPIGLAGGINLYKYTVNPLTWIDPLGLAGCTLTKSKSKNYEYVLKLKRSEYPATFGHISDAIDLGHAKVVTIQRGTAKANRKTSLKNIKTKPGYDRDEWPMAMFKEGGDGASVRYIDPSDNRGAGSSIGNVLSELPDGTRIKVEVI
ncbi:MAG: RHS repeat-associated core domain-containing protein, partial [Enterobacter sp.]|nr:RHS repeat-associated core domain-containing protein [Enterobacter sp.]